MSRAVHMYGEASTGTPRMRISILVELQPHALETASADRASLAEIGTQFAKAISIDTDDVRIVTMEQSTFYERDEPKFPALVSPDPMENLFQLVERLLKLQLGEDGGDAEKWRGGDRDV